MSNSNSPDSIESDNLIRRIKKNLIEPTYYADIKNSICKRERWKLIGDLSDATGRIFSGLSIILAFSAGFFDMKILSFVAGCTSTISLVILYFSSYAFKTSKKHTEQANKILNELGIEPIVDVIDQIDKNMIEAESDYSERMVKYPNKVFDPV